MPQARFKSPIGRPDVDETNGVIRGCRIATLDAVSQSEEGYGRGLVMDRIAIHALFTLAKENGDRLPAFFTHSWYEDKLDGLAHDAGVWNEFSIDVSGNLTATFTAFETPHKAGIFSRAKVDPDGIAISPLFDYTLREGSKNLCTPTAFLSSDFVKRGAINKALFSEQNEKQPMDITELLTALDDPAVKAAVKAILKSHTGPDEEADDTAADATESDAGVTAEDKKPEDDQKPALMRSALRVQRATLRQAKAIIATEKTAILSEAAMKGEASATALLGKGKFVQQTEDVRATVDTALAGYIAAGAPNRATAILRFANDKPVEYNAAVAAGKL